MTFKVQVGPPQIAIHQAETVLVTEPDGQVKWPTERGLYFRDTRVISAWTIYANGEQWDLLNGGAIAPHAARVFLTNRTFMSEERPIPARTLGLMIGRQIDGGLHEDIDITNDSQNPVRFNLEYLSAPISRTSSKLRVRKLCDAAASLHRGWPSSRYSASPIATKISAAA